MEFWRKKKLRELTRDEWESLCDGCARCCLEKLENAENGEISYTNVACTLLDMETCQCKNYAERQRYVLDCVALNPENIGELKWMPPSCAYRLLAEGRDLPDWHPLISGRRQSVVAAGISVRGRCVAEKDVGAWEDHIVSWLD